MTASQRWIVDPWLVIFCGKSLEQRRVRTKFFSSAMKLPCMAQNDLGASFKGPDGTANLNILLAILTEFADLFTIAVHAHDGEPALLVRSLRATDIEKARAIGKLYNVVDMGRYADVLMQMFQRILRTVAGRGSV